MILFFLEHTEVTVQQPIYRHAANPTGRTSGGDDVLMKWLFLLILISLQQGNMGTVSHHHKQQICQNR